MAGKELDVVAIITPKVGKVDRVAELLSGLTKAVHKNEPGCLRYHLHREINSRTGAEDLVMIEQYADQSAYESHSKTPDFQNLVKILTEEELLASPLVIKYLKSIAGFASRL
ncbi:hypothetical protein MMC16_001059 [Acarospora aff. strigata]|nr:hypothetical protein [Acarospora aff. strigata]